MENPFNIPEYSANKFIVLFFILLSFISCNKSKKNGPPNVILLLADDIGYGDLSCFGSNEIETPNIDKLADDGIKLGNFYARSAVCNPFRVSRLPGKFPIRYDVRKHFIDITNNLQNKAIQYLSSKRKKRIKKNNYNLNIFHLCLKNSLFQVSYFY